MISRWKVPSQICSWFWKLRDPAWRSCAGFWRSFATTVSDPFLPYLILVVVAISFAFAFVLHASADIVAGMFAIGVVTAIVESRLRK